MLSLIKAKDDMNYVLYTHRRMENNTPKIQICFAHRNIIQEFLSQLRIFGR